MGCLFGSALGAYLISGACMGQRSDINQRRPSGYGMPAPSALSSTGHLQPRAIAAVEAGAGRLWPLRIAELQPHKRMESTDDDGKARRLGIQLDDTTVDYLRVVVPYDQVKSVDDLCEVIEVGLFNGHTFQRERGGALLFAPTRRYRETRDERNDERSRQRNKARTDGLLRSIF